MWPPSSRQPRERHQYVIPHSHQAPDSDHRIRTWPPEEQTVPIELAADGVPFFCYGTTHRTLANTTDQERDGMHLHFRDADYPAPIW